MRTVSRIAACLACVVLHASGTPNPTIGTTGQTRCVSFAEAETSGLDVSALREEYKSAVLVFPDRKPDLAVAWRELQYALRDRLRDTDLDDLGGSSVFSVVLFEADGRIALLVHRGLEPDQEPAFCRVVEELSAEYRFPLRSEVRFSQCGTTHFGED